VPTSVSINEHLAGLETAGHRLIELSLAAGLQARVPTCPAWTVDALVAHQAMVHRWATAHVRGDNPEAVPNQTEVRDTVTDLPAYYRDGLRGLLDALRDAPEDLEAMTFLKDAPSPRRFWARRQCHETTIHMVDALAAAEARLPTTGEAAVDAALAVDGIDEILRGFYTRGKSKLYDGEAFTMAVVPTDADRRWILQVAERLTVEPGDPPVTDDGAAATISGSAAALYLALWNRGDEVEVTGRPELLEHWRATQRVTWS
jgi:uncharacterized protein (TIGR03083 family)